MADEATEAPAEEQATPDEQSGPEEQAPAPDSQEESTPQDYESRYNDLRPQYDQTQNENQQLNALINRAQQGDPEALTALGLELVDEDEADDDEYQDPDDRIARIEEQLAERDQMSQAEQEESQEMDWLAENLDALEKSEGAQLSDKEMEIVVTNAMNNRLDNGQPNLEGAFKALREVQGDYQKSYVESKRAPKAPSGTAGTEKLDLSTDEKREEAMVRIMQEEGSD